MLNISHIINASPFRTTFLVETHPDAVFTDGIWVSGDAVVSGPVSGSITPATPDQMLKIPEGERQSEGMRLITQFQLKISKNSAEADIVIYLGHRYRVFAPSEWRGNGFSDVLIQRESND